jgi:hypothetical protein
MSERVDFGREPEVGRVPEFTDSDSLLSPTKQVVHILKHRRARVRVESSIRLQAREAGLGSRDTGGRPRAMIWPTVAGDRLVLSSFHQVRILHRFRSLALGRAVPLARRLVEFIPFSGLLPPKFPPGSEHAL